MIPPALSKSQRQERELLIAAMKQMGLTNALVEAFRRALLEPRVNRSYVFPEKKHRLPPLRSDQSLKEWKREADEYLQKVRDEELRIALLLTGVDAPPIAGLLITRGPGKTGRNASTDERYKWAAHSLLFRLLSGRPSWKEIAGEAEVSTVSKAATEILRRAGLDQVRRRPRPNRK